MNKEKIIEEIDALIKEAERILLTNGDYYPATYVNSSLFRGFHTKTITFLKFFLISGGEDFINQIIKNKGGTKVDVKSIIEIFKKC